MRKQDIITLAVALGVAVLAFVILLSILNKSSKPKYSFVVASHAIAKDAILVEEDVTMSPPIEQTPTQQQLDDLFLQKKDVIGQQALEDIPAGNLINRSKVKLPAQTTAGGESVEAIPIPAGKRSLALSADELANFPEEIRVGSYVDVFGVVATADGKEDQQPIVLDVQVRSITRREDGEVKAASLILSSRATDAVTRATQSGPIRLVLREDGQGKEDIVSNAITFVEVIKGVSKERVALDRSNFYEEKTMAQKVMSSRESQ